LETVFTMGCNAFADEGIPRLNEDLQSPSEPR